jgi:hypothetical protein
VKTILPFVVLLLLSLPFTTCKKEHPPAAVLPAITQEGKNTIGFKIDGKVWVPYYKCGIGRDPCGEISFRYGPPYGPNNLLDFQIARQQSSGLSALTITSLTPITTIGNKCDSLNIDFQGEQWNGNNDVWNKNFNGPPGNFEITKLDTVNGIISGIFSFTLYEENRSGRTIQITDGRFDFKINACICSPH